MKIALLGYGTVGRGVDEIVSARVPQVEVSRILELPDRLTDPRMTSSYEEILVVTSLTEEQQATAEDIAAADAQDQLGSSESEAGGETDGQDEQDDGAPEGDETTGE